MHLIKFMKNQKQEKKINLFQDRTYRITTTEFNSFDKDTLHSFKKILIIKWGGMGDLIQASAVINDILENFSGIKVDLNTMPQWFALFKFDKRINRIWGFNSGSWIKKIVSIFKWLRIVKKENYDLIIDLQTNDRSRIMLTILKLTQSKPKYIVGNHPIYPYTPKPKSLRKINQPFIRLQRTIATIGVQPTGTKPSLIFPSKVPKKITNLLKKNYIIDKEFIIFIAGSSKSNQLKRWGIKNFVNLSNLINDLSYKVVLIGGKDDIEENNSILKHNKDVINLCNKIALEDLIYIFKKAKLIIANDTGPTHLAACSHTPIIQITGPTNPIMVKPFGENIESIQSDIECKNCYKKVCSHHSCMSDINPLYVFGLIKKFI